MDTNTILMASLGGVLIGLASALLMLFNGRIAGISGIFRGVLVPQRGDLLWRSLFVLGLVAGGVLMYQLQPEMFPTQFETSVPLILGAGLLVGFGTRLGSGCTSGHGVCGLSRFSPRSLVSTLTFITAGAVVVFIVRHLLG